MLEKMAYFALLKDFYGSLLTDRQQDILNLYYDNDLSLSEIAENMNTSRQAIFDMVKRAEKSLQEYEAKLGLVKRHQESRQRLQEINTLLAGLEIEEKNFKRIHEILEELTGGRPF